MSAESPRACRGAGAGAALTVPAQPPADRSLIDAVSGFINDVTLTAAAADPKDVIQWARFETADINEPTPEGEGDSEISPLLLVLGYGTGVQVWLVPPAGDAQEVLSWRHGTVRVLRVLPTPAPRPHSADCFAAKRPLIALCDSAGPGPAFCSLGFISVRGGEQVKSIKFKSPIVDVVCNKRSVVVSFSERFAVFDACSLEDRLSVTTCYPSPSLAAGGAPHNPLALGARWLAYADRRLNPSKRSAGGCDGEGQSSYTATVLHAAKSLSKGLRGLGETVAHSLAGTRVASQSPSPPHAESPHPGVVTVLDVAGDEAEDEDEGEARDPVVAHFTAHSEAIIALAFDSSGLVLVSADRRGHDFHVFRVNPHPRSPALASVHHLYVLHRGGTTARVQDIAISADCRWVCVSTLRGTTHVFAVCPYGGAAGVRTHTAPRVVNRLSRFHRSAGLPVLPPHAAAPAAPGSPAAAPVCESAWRSGAWYPNPRLPPYPQPTVCAPLAQLRPTASLATHTITRTSSGRQRLSSLSEDTSSAPLLARAAWGAGAGGARAASGAHHALYLMTASGCLMHLVLHPRPAAGVPKEKISDDSPIEVDVEQVAQWPLQRPPTAGDLLAPLPPCNPLLQPPDCARRGEREPCASEEERWLAQVEIVTHAGPHRRLWMGPQFVFKTYNSTGSSSSLSEAETVEVETSVGRGVARSNPVNMPGVRPLVPVLVDSGSASSLEHSPSDSFRRKHLLAETGRAPSACDLQLREDLAEAMQEDHGWWCSAPAQGADGAAGGGGSRGVELAVDPAGCVVRARSSGGAPHDHEHEHYTRANSDETTFRAVVRAPAALPPRDLPARPLPRTTTIPVQPLHSADSGRTDARDRTEHARMSEADDPPNTDSNVEISSQILEAVTRAKPKSDDKKVVRDKRDSKTAKTKRNSECKITEREGVEMKKEMTSSKNEAVEAVSAKRDSSAAKVSSEEMKFEKEATSITTEESKSETETPRKEVFETTKPIEGTKSETKSRTGKESPDIKTLTKETSDTKSSAKKESFESKVSLKEVTSEMKTSVKELSDSKASTKKDVNYLTTTRAPVAESTESTEFPKPKPYSKEGSGDRDSSPRKEPKSFSAWKKDSPKLDWTINTEPLERTISSRKEADVSKTLRLEEVLIKTEEQAWDMLLNEPEKRVLSVSPQSMASDKSDENKTKSKRNRKIKKSQDDTQNKSEDDSFVEIHAIEEKAQLYSGELVSISLPFEEIESAYCSFSSKAKKSRSPKITIEKEQCQPKLNDWSLEDIDCNIQLRSSNKRRSVVSGIELASEYDLKAKLEESKIKNVDSSDTADKQNIVMKDSLKDKKPKPVVPGQDSRKPVEKSLEIDVKDVYVIDTTKDEFPEIQITTSRGSKMRKKSSQLDIDKGNDDIEVIPEKPIKSWSSIAADKNSKKSEEDKRSASAKIENIVDNTEDDVEAVQLEKNRKANKREEDEEPLSLHEELMRLCKRTDIMVAQCDAPSALNFVEDHHSLLHDLPPLELDFGLDNFRLEVMRDSLLEVDDTKLSSPICKIDIDSIISSIKESTSAFNLIDLEKIPDKKEKGFSVVENDKYTSQEVKADDDSKCEGKEIEVIEKSSEDENASPALSTDSDKEDKRSSGASNVTLPSSKQSSKSKKSRRKKK